jgi:hypothetical protein
MTEPVHIILTQNGSFKPVVQHTPLVPGLKVLLTFGATGEEQDEPASSGVDLGETLADLTCTGAGRGAGGV